MIDFGIFRKGDEALLSAPSLDHGRMISKNLDFVDFPSFFLKQMMMMMFFFLKNEWGMAKCSGLIINVNFKKFYCITTFIGVKMEPKWTKNVPWYAN